MKPMLASDYSESKIQFPVIAQPKIDGVRALNMTGELTGRSLKRHANKHVTNYFSHPSLIGFDGEMAAEHECHPALCRLTSSALSTVEGTPWILWHVFDYITPETILLPYVERIKIMAARALNQSHSVRCIPSTVCSTLQKLLDADAKWLDMGYEGTIIRDPQGMHKQGRSTIKEGGLLRIKRFLDFEIVVTEIIEGVANANEAKTNELGLQFRSSHQENMVPNGMVGAMLGRVMKDILDAKGAVLFAEGSVIKIGAGSMTHDDRVRFFKDPSLLLGQVAKAKMFPLGIKVLPRFPTFQSIRSMTDL